MRCLNVVALILVIIGALNWGLWGFFQFDLVAWLFGGNTTWLSRLIYAIIGLAGLWSLGYMGKCCAHCCCPKCLSSSDKNACGEGKCCAGCKCQKCAKDEGDSDKRSKGGCCRM